MDIFTHFSVKDVRQAINSLVESCGGQTAAARHFDRAKQAFWILVEKPLNESEKS